MKAKQEATEEEKQILVAKQEATEEEKQILVAKQEATEKELAKIRKILAEMS